MRQLIDCRLLICLLHLYNLAKTASSHIVVCPVFISHLSTSLSSSILPSLLESCIPVCPNNAVIEPRAIDKSHCVFSICSRVILHEAEATGCFLDLVQPHDDPLDITTFGEELLDLLFGGVEGQVAHVQRGGDLQELLLQLFAPPEVLVSVTADLAVGVAVEPA